MATVGISRATLPLFGLSPYYRHPAAPSGGVLCHFYNWHPMGCGVPLMPYNKYIGGETHRCSTVHPNNEQIMTNFTSIVESLPIYECWESSKQSIWEDSKFQSFRNIPSPKSKGSQGEKLVQQLLQSLGHKVTKPLNSDHDRVIDGYKT